LGSSALERPDQRPLVWFQAHPGAQQIRERSPAIDVRHEIDIGPALQSNAHVDNIAAPQVPLGRTARGIATAIRSAGAAWASFDT